MLKKIKVEDAVGLKLAHDHTQIIPGKFKGPRFRRGHLLRKSDLPKLLDMGKKEVYVLTLPPGEVHEDEAAKRIARGVAGRNLKLRAPREGKVDFIARTSGLLKVNVAALEKINRIGEIIFSTRHTRSIVKAGDIVAGTRIIPLFIREAKVSRAEEIGRRLGPVIELLPLRPKRIGILVTGSEIVDGRIKDRSASIVARKAEALGSKVTARTVVTDDPSLIAAEIGRMKKTGCQVIVTTGGLSVDPDDVTLAGIRRSGAEVVFYGTPVLPGAMFAYARLGKTVILGTPACVVHDPVTALDVFLPRVLADDPISAKDVAPLGHGGLCLRCAVCRYPVCPFAKGG
ncbi:MAG: molybdopterin-binding protein [Syntrophales bacterium]